MVEDAKHGTQSINERPQVLMRTAQFRINASYTVDFRAIGIRRFFCRNIGESVSSIVFVSAGVRRTRQDFQGERRIDAFTLGQCQPFRGGGDVNAGEQLVDGLHRRALARLFAEVVEVRAHRREQRLRLVEHRFCGLTP